MHIEYICQIGMHLKADLLEKAPVLLDIFGISVLFYLGYNIVGLNGNLEGPIWMN